MSFIVLADCLGNELVENSANALIYQDQREVNT